MKLLGDPHDSDGPQMLGSEALYHASEFADTTCLKMILEASRIRDESPTASVARWISRIRRRPCSFWSTALIPIFGFHGYTITRICTRP